MPASTLDYWVKTRLVRPSLRQSEGHRVERWWSIEDVVVVLTIRALRRMGASLAEVRRAEKHLREWGRSFADTQAYWDGTDIVVMDENGAPASAVRWPGQFVLFESRLPLGAWEAAARARPEAKVVDLEAFRNARRERRKQQRERRALLAQRQRETSDP